MITINPSKSPIKKEIFGLEISGLKCLPKDNVIKILRCEANQKIAIHVTEKFDIWLRPRVS